MAKPYLPNPLDYFENGVFNESAFKKDFPNSYDEFMNFDTSPYGGLFDALYSTPGYSSREVYDLSSAYMMNGDFSTYFETSFAETAKNPNFIDFRNQSYYDTLITAQEYSKANPSQAEIEKSTDAQTADITSQDTPSQTDSSTETENSTNIDNSQTSTSVPTDNEFSLGIDSIDTSVYFIGLAIIITALVSIWAIKRALGLFK